MVSLLTLLCLFHLTLSKVPKKYANKEDKSLYCNVCSNIMIDVEEMIMKNVEELSGSVLEYKLDSKGNRKKKRFSYDFDEDDINGAIEGVCGSWGSNLGTSQKSDGSVEMLKSGQLSGSFSGSLNFGGEASDKILAMCRSNIRKHRKYIREVVSSNDLNKLKTFCKDYVSKKCKKVKYPKELADQIEALVKKGTTEEEETEDEVELKEDL